MSDILTIDTSKDLYTNSKPLEPLPLFDDNHPYLSKVMPDCDITALPNTKMTNLVQQLKMTMKRYGGIGLSANQCGVIERMFVIGHEDFSLTCINPKVVEVSEDLANESEGCLSYPGLYLKIKRPSWIVGEFTTEEGKTERMRMEGITARCFLHELDHMDGKKFVELVGPATLMTAKRKQEKMMKKIIRKQKKK